MQATHNVFQPRNRFNQGDSQSVRYIIYTSAGFEGRASNRRLLLIVSSFRPTTRHETAARHVDGNGHETVKNFKRTKLGTKRGKNQRAVLTRARAIAIFIVGRPQFSACQFAEITCRQILFFPFCIEEQSCDKEKRINERMTRRHGIRLKK